MLLIVASLGSLGSGVLLGGSPGTVAAFLAVAALAFAASAWLLGAVGAAEEPAPPRTGVWGEAVEGVRFTLAHPVLRAIVVYLVGLTALNELIEDFATRPDRPEFDEGTLLGAALSWMIYLATPFGALLAMLLHRRAGTFRLAWVAILVSQPFALLLVLGGTGWGPIWHVLGQFVPWTGAALAAVTLLSHRQAITPSRLLGRSGATLIVLLGLASVAGSLLEALARFLTGPLEPAVRRAGRRARAGAALSRHHSTGREASPRPTIDLR
ncbi:hypothetical protein [Nonomuraea sp. LPB2021202275-12-8]|uniref:hypothetical protein n=1 Tax=Nonomuraea sp. LPB2021202275-12-8 TaxID=3120159 RepID=UPI00300CC278